MDDHSSGVQGRAGQASYSPETQSWTFARALQPARPVTYTGITKTTVPPSRRLYEFDVQETNGALLNAHPQLAPIWSSSSTSRDERFSHAISKTTQIYEPLVSGLFDVGVARGADWERDIRSFPIVVTAAGECGERLCFRVMDEDSLELDLGAGVPPSSIPSVGSIDVMEWAGSSSRSSVRQISFADNVQRSTPSHATTLLAHWNPSTWMTARFAHSTTIFRPLYHRQPFPTDVGDAVVRSSRIHPNAVVEIPSSKTGGFEHAHVAFNPWYQRQFAIVDIAGNWSIWDISGAQKPRPLTNDTWAADCVKWGVLPRLPKTGSGAPRHDGWAKIGWITDSTTLMVSDRRCIVVYRLQGDQPALSYTLGLALERGSEWILDVARSSYDLSHLFVLSTSRIFWFNLSLDTFLAAEEDGSTNLLPRFSWRHFRDTEDTTLQLSSLHAGDSKQYSLKSLQVQC